MNRVFYLIITGMLLVSCEPKAGNDGSADRPDRGVEAAMEMQEVHFMASDGLEVVADLYPHPSPSKVIVLFHQAGFSRGAYRTIAPRLVAQGYACLAVDLRNGGMAREVVNKTHENAVKRGEEPSYAQAEPDLRAAIDYAYKNISKQVVLWGSSYSATLAMMVGRDHRSVDRVVAFSPGLYFGSEQSVIERFREFGKPLFVTSARSEMERVRAFVAPAGDRYLQIAEPEFEGEHGSKTLWVQNASTEAVFTDILRFLK